MKTSQILKLMKVVSWIIFIGLCIKIGTVLISFFVSLVLNPEASRDLYLGLDLSSIYSLWFWLLRSYGVSHVALIDSASLYLFHGYQPFFKVR